MRLSISPLADHDLAEIWVYSAEHWSADQANRYIRMLNEGFAAVAKNILRARACDEIRSGYFRFNAGSHVVFCRIQGDTLDIVRVLHQRMDFQRHL